LFLTSFQFGFSALPSREGLSSMILAVANVL
jgi:hypothetical protein